LGYRRPARFAAAFAFAMLRGVNFVFVFDLGFGLRQGAVSGGCMRMFCHVDDFSLAGHHPAPETPFDK
jgi:hypothetical protein